MPAADALAIVVVTHESADDLADLAGALLPQLRDDDELVIVDNASSDATVARARSLGGPVRVIEQAKNLGFCGGCNAGAAATNAPLLFFLNPDSRPHPDALAHLRGAAGTHPEWAAWQALVLLDDGDVNTSGGVVHYLGIGWAGDCGRPAAELGPEDREIAFASGAALVVRRDDWEQLHGFDEDYFMYGEDLDLGLRLWLAGKRVGLSAAARITHRYEFHKGGRKWLGLERNRWRTVLSVYPAPLLVMILPALLALELALLLVAAREGWLRSKLAAQLAVAGGLGRTLARRRRVQSTRRVSAAEFAAHLTASLESPYLQAARSPVLRVPQAAYWTLVRGALALGARPRR